MPDAVKIALFTRGTYQKGGKQRLANALEALPFPVTHWGIEERKLSPYVRQEFVDALPREPHFLTPTIARRKTAKYKGYISLAFADLQGFHIELDALEDGEGLRPVFEFGSNLANSLEPFFGFVHPVWYKKGQEYNVAGRLTAKEVREFGPRSLCARTWLSSTLVQMLGRERIEACGLEIRETAWGGLELDLLPDPWSSTIRKLESKRKKAMEILAPAGIFGDYAKSFHYAPGANWGGFGDSLDSE